MLDWSCPGRLDWPKNVLLDRGRDWLQKPSAYLIEASDPVPRLINPLVITAAFNDKSDRAHFLILSISAAFILLFCERNVFSVFIGSSPFRIFRNFTVAS